MCASFQKIIFIVGPTASGKSDVACRLARRIHGEIISCDSMQVYKEVSIATNKPSQEMLRAVSHHLINIVSVHEEFDVARFAALAFEVIRDIHARRHIPIIVGGSGLYMQILLDGIFPASPKNVPLREELMAQAQMYGHQFLFDKLKQVDAEITPRIHPRDLRRVIRALEVGLTHGRPISELQNDREGLWGRYDIKIVALDTDRQWLYEKINERVDAMFLEGVVDEIKGLERLPLSLTAGRIIGVREIRGYLNGDYDENQARHLMKLNTRRFAKRQLTWFRREKRLRWIMIEKDDTVEGVAERIIAVIGRDDVLRE
jgi:tRNA dimethylallyltransferase